LQQAWDLDPGDLLYLPPGVAHHGVALGDPAGADGTAPLCMTWSIGMRAPSAADLLQALGESLAAKPGEGGRYRDPGLPVPAHAGEIDSAAISGLRDLARSAIDDPAQFTAFLGAFLSGYRLAHEPAPPPRPVGPAGLKQLLRQGAVLRQHPWTRLAWLETPGGTLLCAAGACFRCDAGLAALLCDPEALRAATNGQLEADPTLLCDLINRGHLVIEKI
jgi:50S ribosomal protein L16 3-hydroxylase